MWKTFKQLYNYHSFCCYCVWAENWEKASWICDNRIEPLAKKYPILNFIVSII
jgi:hypothetical protein